MTEAEWLTSNEPRRMLAFLQSRISDRKLRLFVCACCHRTLDESPYEDLANAVKIAEDLVDRKAAAVDLADAEEAVTWGKAEMCESLNRRAEGLAVAYQARPITVADAAHAVEQVLLGWRMNVPDINMKAEQDAQCRWLRCVFGNPFRRVALDPAWRKSNVVALAQPIYDERAFDRLPLLADALEEAGCHDADIIGHCRQPESHVQGCWVVDLILGKM